MMISYGNDKACDGSSINKIIKKLFNMENDETTPVLLSYKQIEEDVTQEKRYKQEKLFKELKTFTVGSRVPYCYEDCVYPIEFTLLTNPIFKYNTRNNNSTLNINQNGNRILSTYFQRWIFYKAKYTRIPLITRKKTRRCKCVYKYSRTFVRTFSLRLTLESIKEEEEEEAEEPENISKEMDDESLHHSSGIRFFFEKVVRKLKQRRENETEQLWKCTGPTEESSTYISFTNF